MSIPPSPTGSFATTGSLEDDSRFIDGDLPSTLQHGRSDTLNTIGGRRPSFADTINGFMATAELRRGSEIPLPGQSPTNAGTMAGASQTMGGNSATMAGTLLSGPLDAGKGDRSYHILFLNPGNGHASLMRQLFRLGFFVTSVTSPAMGVELLQDPKSGVRLLLAEITEATEGFVTLMKAAMGLPVCIPSLVMCSGAMLENPTARIGGLLHTCEELGLCGILELPLNIKMAGLRAKILMDRFAVASSMYDSVKRQEQMKMRISLLEKRGPHVGGDHDTLSGHGEEKETLESIDHQYYSLQRAALMRKQRIQIPFEEAKRQKAISELADRIAAPTAADTTQLSDTMATEATAELSKSGKHTASLPTLLGNQSKLLSSSQSQPANMFAQSFVSRPKPPKLSTVRRIVNDEMTKMKTRAEVQAPFLADEHAPKDLDAQDSWIPWMGFDILGAAPKLPEKPTMEQATGKTSYWTTKGLALVELGDMSGAVELFNKAHKCNPKCAGVLLLRGATLMHISKFKQAFSDLNKYCKAQPRDIYGLYNRSLALQALGDHVGAMVDLDAAVQLIGTSKAFPFVFEARARLLRRQGLFLAANTDYDVMRHAPAEVKPKTKLQSLEATGSLTSLSIMSESLESGSVPPPTPAVPAPAPAPAAVVPTHRDAHLAVPAKPTEDEARALASILSNNTDIYTTIFAQATPVQFAVRKNPGERTREDIRVMMPMFSTVDFFCRLSEEQQEDFCQRVTYRQLPPAAYVCRQGDESGEMFIIMSGQCSVRINVTSGNLESELTIGSLEPGQLFGHQSMLLGAKRSVSVCCKMQCQLLCFAHSDCEQMGLRGLFEDDLQDKVRLLRKCGAFSSATDSQVRTLASICQRSHYKSGQTLVPQGVQPEYFCILVKGVVSALKSSDLLHDISTRIDELTVELEHLGRSYVFHRSIHRRSRSNTNVSNEATHRTIGPVNGDMLPAIRLEATVAASEGTEEDTHGVHKRRALEDELNQLLAKRDKLMEARNNASSKTHAAHVGVRHTTIATLFPPAFFGEQAVLNPWDGSSTSAIVADTYVEVLTLNRSQLKSMTFPQVVLDDVRRKALPVLTDVEVHRMYQTEKAWAKVKESAIRQIKKTRWPVSRTAIRELPGGETIIVDEKRDDEFE